MCARVPWRTIGESRTPVAPPVTTHRGARASGYATLYLWVKLGVFAACLSYGPSQASTRCQPLGNFALEPILEGVVLDTAEPHPKVDPMQAGLEPGKAVWCESDSTESHKAPASGVCGNFPPGPLLLLSKFPGKNPV